MSSPRSTNGTPKGDKKSSASSGGDDAPSGFMSKRQFEELRFQNLREDVSEPGFNEDEVIPLYEDNLDDGMGDDAACNDGSMVEPREREQETKKKGGPPADQLQLMLDNTPLKKMRDKNAAASQLLKDGDLWGVLKLRQDCLALAKIYFGPYHGAERGHHPMLLATAHFRLAQAYADMKCFPQTGEHCSQAMQALPQEEIDHDKLASFKSHVNLLMGESLLICEPPKPQIALQHFAAAAETSEAEEASDPSMKFLIGQSLAIIGSARLVEAHVTRQSMTCLEARLVGIKAKLEEIHPKSMERSAINLQMDDVFGQITEELAFEQRLLEEAKEQLDKSVDTLTDVAFAEEERLKKVLEDDEHKQHPLLISLFKRCAELLLKLASVEGLRGDTDTELAHISNVISIQRNYDFLPPGIVSTALKEQGAVYVIGKRYDEALETYNELVELQQQRYPNNPSKMALAQADAFKLIGNVYVAKKSYGRALGYYTQALDLFSKYQGPRSSLAADLEHRISPEGATDAHVNSHTWRWSDLGGPVQR